MARTHVTATAWLMICFAIRSNVARPGSNGDQTCGRLPAVERAFPRTDLKTDNSPPGTTMYYQCVIGYAAHGDTRVHCINSGSHTEWTKPRFSCYPILCQPPTSPDNGELIGTDHSFGQTITYSCKQGYQMFSSNEEGPLTEAPERICTADGTWTSAMPLCKAVVCPDLEPLPHGSIEMLGRTYLTKAIYHCAVGYLLQGNQERRCLESGDWSGSSPKCEEEENDIGDYFWIPAIDDEVTNKPQEEEKPWWKKAWRKVQTGFSNLVSRFFSLFS